MDRIYFLDSIAHENDKIIFIDRLQESDLEDKGYVCDGHKKSNLDNLRGLENNPLSNTFLDINNNKVKLS